MNDDKEIQLNNLAVLEVKPKLDYEGHLVGPNLRTDEQWQKVLNEAEEWEMQCEKIRETILLDFDEVERHAFHHVEIAIKSFIMYLLWREEVERLAALNFESITIKHMLIRWRFAKKVKEECEKIIGNVHGENPIEDANERMECALFHRFEIEWRAMKDTLKAFEAGEVPLLHLLVKNDQAADWFWIMELNRRWHPIAQLRNCPRLWEAWILSV